MTSSEGKWVVDLTEVTETDRRPRERVQAVGGEVNREGPARVEGSRGSMLWTHLAHLRTRVVVVWARRGRLFRAARVVRL